MEKIDEQLNCGICLDTYTDPKLLQCFHTFCKKCLIKLVVRDQQGQLNLACPNCRQITPIPSNGVTGLQCAFQINEILVIREDYKKAKDIIQCQEGRKSDETPHTPPRKVTHYCSEHSKEEIQLYCKSCNELICWKCAIRRGKHQSHDYDPIDEAFGKYKEEMTSSLEPLERQLKVIHTALAQIDTSSRNISDQQATVEASIDTTARQLHKSIDDRKSELVDQLHHMTQGKLKNLVTLKDQMETIQAQLSSCLNFITTNVKTDNQGEVLKMKNAIDRQVKELTIPFQQDLLKPNIMVDTTFSISPDVTSICKTFGKIGSPLDPSSCYATGKGLETAMVGKKSSVIIQPIDCNGKPYEEAIKSLQCEFVSEITHATVSGSIERRGQSQYELCYQPTIKGNHRLHIKVEGQHIRGSPFIVTVTLPIMKLGSLILNIGTVDRPWGVALNKRGEVIVTECQKHCVSVFSPSGGHLRTFGSCGSGPGQFSYPCGVAVDSEGNILVADNSNHRIQRFTSKGQFITSVGTKGDGNLQFHDIRNILFNTSSKKVYVVDGCGRVQILNYDLTFSSVFGNKGSDKGQFSNPRDISCDSAGNVYVTDTSNHRIQVFTPEGRLLSMFGRYGVGMGDLNYPSGIAIDSNNMVYISDSSHRVSVFTIGGQFITSFGRKGNETGEFNCPLGLAVDVSGVVYVCDEYNNRIQVFL